MIFKIQNQNLSLFFFLFFTFRVRVKRIFFTSWPCPFSHTLTALHSLSVQFMFRETVVFVYGLFCVFFSTAAHPLTLRLNNPRTKLFNSGICTRGSPFPHDRSSLLGAPVCVCVSAGVCWWVVVYLGWSEHSVIIWWHPQCTYLLFMTLRRGNSGAKAMAEACLNPSLCLQARVCVCSCMCVSV